MSDTSETDVFSLCESSAEVYLLVYRETGLAGVEHLFGLGTGATRQGLRRDAAVFARLGMKPLADLLRREARKAKPAPPTLQERFRMAERRSGALPGFVPNWLRHN